MWSIAMTFALRNKNKLGFIDGSCKKDPSNPGLANQWDMCNSIVFTWILNSLSPELFAGAIYTKTASEIWNELKETYDKVDGSVVFNLHNNINSLNQNGSTLADYYNILNSLWKQFNAMIFAIRSNLLTRESLPSVKTAFSVISGEESYRNVTSARTTKPAATVFAVKTFDNKKKFNNNYKGSGSNSNFNSNNNNRGPNPNLKCTNCNKTGHTVDRCFDLIGYPAGYVKRNSNFNSRPVTSNNVSAKVQSNGVSSNNATTGNSPVSLSSDQLARLMNLLNENGVSTANANMADSLAIKDIGHLLIIENPKRPNDEGRVSSNDDGPELSLDINQGNDDASATSMDETNNTHPKGTVPDETDFINDFYENSEFNSETEELPVHTLRRSSRQTKLPSSLNDFIVEEKVKYRVERVMNYANLNHDNYCFISALNKSVEPTCYEKAILDRNWMDAMNAEIEALNENHTWEITDLQPNRKAIGNKWIY
ncbi:ribonuclease H-like domain-containing protein [Tanacetum coccineum]